ncbi:MAG: hypothetical protein HWD59_10190 [Coxiellaceae bacterium]|nr:MAG: hypothetical protein HWD59_10190 [Coxiellaceae bacterium]
MRIQIQIQIPPQIQTKLKKNTVKTRNQRNWEKLGGKTHELPPEFLFDQQLMDFPTIVTMKNNLAEVMEYASIPQNESIQSIELDFFKRVAIQKFLEEKYAAKVVTPNRSANKKK